jgi:anthranilate/para-aminobenzoate synthase component I
METRNLSDQNKFQVLESLDLWLQRYMIRKVSGSEDAIQIFFDFTEVQILDCRDAFLTTQKLLENNHEENELSYSGKIGFFSYEYLCHLAGFNPTAEKDLELPDALWARPQSIITLESGRCEIETLLAGRLVEVVGFLNSPLGMTISQKVPDFCSKNKQWKCNIDFDSYKELFDQA